jgi:hypothetical protein
MRRLNATLLTILAVQLALLAAFLWPREQPGAGESNAPLLSLSADSVDRLIISDGESSIGLSRRDDSWVIPDYHGLPADGARLNGLLETLPGLARGWPVAQTTGALTRFEVADDSFQRRLEYFGDGEALGALYLGTSPGFRKVHIRPADADAVYSVEFNTFDAPVAAADWLEKTLLQLQLDEVSAIRGLDYALTLEGDQWRSLEGAVPEQSQVDALLNGLSSMRVTAAADVATASVLEEMGAPATLTVTSGGETRELRLYEIDGAHYIDRDDIPVYFSISAFDHDRLNDVNAANLFPAVEADSDATASPVNDIPADMVDQVDPAPAAIPGEASP